MTRGTRAANQSVADWKHQITKQAAKEYEVPEKAIRVVPKDSRRPVYATWKLLQPLLCPINEKVYRVYWVRTHKEFMNSGVRKAERL